MRKGQWPDGGFVTRIGSRQHAGRMQQQTWHLRHFNKPVHAVSSCMLAQEHACMSMQSMHGANREALCMHGSCVMHMHAGEQHRAAAAITA